MRTVVGAMSGYCETASRVMAKAPASMVTMASTQAKTGRWMKNFAMAQFCPGAGWRVEAGAPPGPPVPVPAAGLLLLGGVGGVGGLSFLARRKKA